MLSVRQMVFGTDADASASAKVRFSVKPSRKRSIVSSAGTDVPHFLHSSARTSSSASTWSWALSQASLLQRAASVRFFNNNHQRRRQVDLATTNDHNFWSMNIPGFNSRKDKDLAVFDPFAAGNTEWDTNTYVRGEPFYYGQLYYHEVRIGETYYLLYQYRSVLDGRISVAFQQGVCRLSFNYRSMSWVFIFVRVRNLYHGMAEEDCAVHTQVVIFDTRTPVAYHNLYYRELALAMEGQPRVLGMVIRDMYRDPENGMIDTHLDHYDLDSDARFNLRIFTDVKK